MVHTIHNFIASITALIFAELKRKANAKNERWACKIAFCALFHSSQKYSVCKDNHQHLLDFFFAFKSVFVYSHIEEEHFCSF